MKRIWIVLNSVHIKEKESKNAVDKIETYVLEAVSPGQPQHPNEREMWLRHVDQSLKGQEIYGNFWYFLLRLISRRLSPIKTGGMWINLLKVKKSMSLKQSPYNVGAFKRWTLRHMSYGLRPVIYYDFLFHLPTNLKEQMNCGETGSG